MNTLDLNQKEKEELKHYHFLIKKTDFINRFITLLVVFVVWLSILFFVNYLAYYLVANFLYKDLVIVLLLTINLFILKSIKIFQALSAVFLSEYYFYTTSWIIAFNKLYPNQDKIKKSNSYKYADFFDENLRWEKRGRKGMPPILMLFVYIVLPIYMFFFFKYESMVIPIYYLWLNLVLSVCIIFWLKYVIRYFNPLYAFWNTGAKLQSLTPKIEEQSKEIQKNFQKGMSFQALSEWFDSLSSTFSVIVSLVIKLENVEKLANKWNLFDSEKYINSLRADIVEPLKSLRIFLKKQGEQLEESQEELKKVRLWIGWEDSSHSSVWQAHIFFNSKRSEPVINELTENIAKLDAMIWKMST